MKYGPTQILKYRLVQLFDFQTQIYVRLFPLQITVKQHFPAIHSFNFPATVDFSLNNSIMATKPILAEKPESLVPLLDLTGSGNVGKPEKFSHYVGKLNYLYLTYIINAILN